MGRQVRVSVGENMTAHDFTPASTHHGVCATCNLPKDRHDAQQEGFARDAQMEQLLQMVGAFDMQDWTKFAEKLYADMTLLKRGVGSILAAIGQNPVDLGKMRELALELGWEPVNPLLVR